MDHQPNQLSGGQRQRYRTTLVNKTSIILADEPTGNLDSKTSLENYETLWRHPCQWKYSYSSNSRRGNCSLCAHRIIRLRDGLIESDTTKIDPF
jgi:putative ABC transport system ATP-binding protein